MTRNNLALTSLIFIISLSVNAQDFTQEGIASFYADKFEGRTTANGEKYRHSKMTAAHKTLLFGTMVKVTNLENGKSVVVRINDRGPFVQGRIIDLSKSAAEKLGYVNQGLAKVKLEIVDHAGSDDSRGQISSVPQSSTGSSGKIYYKVHADEFSPSGYGVQIGSYEEMSNLIKLIDGIGSKYGDDVTVRVTNLNGKKVYQVIVGQEKSRDKAEKLKSKLAKTYSKCFVVKF